MIVITPVDGQPFPDLIREGLATISLEPQRVLWSKVILRQPASTCALDNRERIDPRTSKPSFVASNPGRFDPVGSVQLGDGFGEIVAYGPLC